MRVKRTSLYVAVATLKRSRSAMAPIVTLVSKANPSLWADAQHAIALSCQLDSTYDLAIIGGGFSGLWSAYHLKKIDPNLRIAIFEAAKLGFGASGRNGGWASSEYPVSQSTLTRRIGEGAARKLFQALHEAIDEIGTFATSNPEVGFVKSGSLYFARNRAQLTRLVARYPKERILRAEEVRELLDISGAIGGVFDPECATIHPFKLIEALVLHLLKQGVAIFENSWATPVEGGVLVNSDFVAAKGVISATEVYGRPRREFIPLYSLMVATEPLSDSIWKELGNSKRFTFAEASHMINYAQRTMDNRIAIGGRGATYPWGSKLKSSKESTNQVHERIRSLLKEWFPILLDIEFTHEWGGAVAITRDWEPYVQWNKENGLGRIGGYAGDGVTMSYLAAKILAAEILEINCEIRSLHFVNRPIRKWEPEPFRYLGVNTLVKLSGLADREERLTGRPSLLNQVIEPLILR